MSQNPSQNNSSPTNFDFVAMQKTMSNDKIQTILKDHKIALTVDEAIKIQAEILMRPPTLAECVLWGIQGSEHCSYKSSRPFLKQFPTTGPTVMLGVGEDAGIIEIAQDNNGKKYGIVISHESHNSPSQVVPYEGAATGIGGNVRDVNCMGAKVIGCSDSLRFGDIDRAKSRWIHHGVVEGVAGYGNPIGVPNIGGDLYYDSSFNSACLVNVVTLGVICEDEIIHSHAPDNAVGYDLILIGKPTDNSGFGGASFSSQNVDETKKEANKGAVQEPNAFLKRHILKANYELYKKLKKLKMINQIGFKDLGAGGIACASVELADGNGYGAEIYLDKVHTTQEGYDPAVILCSETQERFMWAVPSSLSPMIVEHYNTIFDFPNVSKGAMASVVGTITAGDKTSAKGEKTGAYTVIYKGQKIIDALACDITRGIVYDRPYTDPKTVFVEPSITINGDKIRYNNQIKPQSKFQNKSFDEVLLAILGHENVASRLPVYENFDKNVQGIVVIEAGEADACVLQPFKYDNYPTEISNIGLVFKQDNNPNYGKISPYWGGVNAVLECARNISAVGGVPLGLSDCLNFGNPEKPYQMWAFVEGVRGVSAACKSFELKDYPNNCLPVVSGNVSLYKETDGKSIAPSPMIGIVGRISDVNKAIKMSLQKPDSKLLLVGKRKDECGGSTYYSLFGELGANVPMPNIQQTVREINVLTDCIEAGLVLSCHDISDGGLAGCISEMSFRNSIGCQIDLLQDAFENSLKADKILFSETGGWILEANDNNVEQVKNLFASQGVEIFEIGTTNDGNKIQIQVNNQNLINLDLQTAKTTWTNGLRDKL